MQFLATGFHFLHLLSYSQNGVGLKALDVINDILGAVTQVSCFAFGFEYKQPCVEFVF